MNFIFNIVLSYDCFIITAWYYLRFVKITIYRHLKTPLREISYISSQNKTMSSLQNVVNVSFKHKPQIHCKIRHVRLN